MSSSSLELRAGGHGRSALMARISLAVIRLFCHLALSVLLPSQNDSGTASVPESECGVLV